MASVGFVAVVILAVFSGISYLAGEAVSPRKASAASPQPAPTPVHEAVVTPSTPAPAAAPAPAPPRDPIIVPASDPFADKPEPPVFSDPTGGAVYIQMGAVEKGIADVFVEGLRRRGFDAFAAPGPNENIFRVLIGPIPDHDSFTRIKSSLDQMGLSTFARRFQQNQ